MLVWTSIASMVAEHGAAALVQVHEARGSAPRERGAWLVVRPDGAFQGTVGGGALEWQALKAAREALIRGRGPARMMDQVLGPDLGQCCGGRVRLLIETFDERDRGDLARLARLEGNGPGTLMCRLAQDGRVERELERPGRSEGRPSGWSEPCGEQRTPLLLFGAGHVGRALVLALAPLPFTVRWIDNRNEAFPAHLPGCVRPVLAQDPVRELHSASRDAFVLVMTHSHPLDLAITAAALQGPFRFVGLIGSATKRARFEKRFREFGIDEQRIAALACPIGLPGITGKAPATIAASVAAQLLIERERANATPEPPIQPNDKDRHDPALTG